MQLRGAPNEENIVNEFAKEIGSQLLAFIRRMSSSRHAKEMLFGYRKAPDSEIATVYRKLAKSIMGKGMERSCALDDTRLRELTRI